jgi:hypothetical protein
MSSRKLTLLLMDLGLTWLSSVRSRSRSTVPIRSSLAKSPNLQNVQREPTKTSHGAPYSCMVRVGGRCRTHLFTCSFSLCGGHMMNWQHASPFPLHSISVVVQCGQQDRTVRRPRSGMWNAGNLWPYLWPRARSRTIPDTNPQCTRRSSRTRAAWVASGTCSTPRPGKNTQIRNYVVHVRGAIQLGAAYLERERIMAHHQEVVVSLADPTVWVDIHETPAQTRETDEPCCVCVCVCVCVWLIYALACPRVAGQERIRANAPAARLKNVASIPVILLNCLQSDLPVPCMMSYSKWPRNSWHSPALRDTNQRRQ